MANFHFNTHDMPNGERAILRNEEVDVNIRNIIGNIKL